MKLRKTIVISPENNAFITQEVYLQKVLAQSEEKKGRISDSSVVDDILTAARLEREATGKGLDRLREELSRIDDKTKKEKKGYRVAA